MDENSINEQKIRNRIRIVWFGGILLTLVSILVGPLGFSALDWLNSSLQHISNQNDTEAYRNIFLMIRLPRIVLVFIVGAALSVSGSTLQAIFRNPLVSPYILGLSSGAAFGAALSLAFGFFSLQLSAFAFGFLAVFLSYIMAIKNKQISIVSMILAGVIVNGLFTALLTIVQIKSDPFKLQSIIHWTMGNFQQANWDKVVSSIIPISIGIAVMLIYRWRLNLIALGDEEAISSGINPKRDKFILLGAATLSSAAAVAVAGVIGLYGLIIPHIVRMLVGVNNKISLPLNFIFGGAFLVLIDDISRSISGYEIPIGVFTMIIGTPFFIYLMKKSNIGWE